LFCIFLCFVLAILIGLLIRSIILVSRTRTLSTVCYWPSLAALILALIIVDQYFGNNSTGDDANLNTHSSYKDTNHVNGEVYVMC